MREKLIVLVATSEKEGGWSSTMLIELKDGESSEDTANRLAKLVMRLLPKGRNWWGAGRAYEISEKDEPSKMGVGFCEWSMSKEEANAIVSEIKRRLEKGKFPGKRLLLSATTERIGRWDENAAKIVKSMTESSFLDEAIGYSERKNRHRL